MCRCTPSIKSPYCLKCMPLPGARPEDFDGDAIVYRKQSFERVKEIVKIMDGLSEDGFNNRYFNDPAFHKGLDVLINMVSKKGDLR